MSVPHSRDSMPKTRSEFNQFANSGRMSGPPRTASSMMHAPRTATSMMQRPTSTRTNFTRSNFIQQQQQQMAARNFDGYHHPTTQTQFGRAPYTQAQFTREMSPSAVMRTRSQFDFPSRVDYRHPGMTSSSFPSVLESDYHPGPYTRAMMDPAPFSRQRFTPNTRSQFPSPVFSHTGRY